MLDAFAEGLHRDNARHAPPAGAPTFASRDDAFAIVARSSSSLVGRRLRSDGPGGLADLEPVIVRLVLGALDRSGT